MWLSLQWINGENDENPLETIGDISIPTGIFSGDVRNKSPIVGTSIPTPEMDEDGVIWCNVVNPDKWVITWVLLLW